MSARLVGLAGYARSGKDTVGGILGYEKVGFADPLRDLALHLNPVIEVNDTGRSVRYKDMVEMKGYEWTKESTNARDFLIRLGAGVRTHIHPDIWVDTAMARIKRHVFNGVDVAVTDVRYLNEAEAIREIGGEIWYIDRLGVVPAGVEEERTIREILFYGVDRTIYNHGSLDHLRREVLGS